MTKAQKDKLVALLTRNVEIDRIGYGMPMMQDRNEIVITYLATNGQVVRGRIKEDGKLWVHVEQVID